MQRLIILLAAALLALTLACKAAGGLGNAIQNEMGETGGSNTPATTAAPQAVPAETTATASVQIPGNVPTPDPTIAAAIVSISDIGPPEICFKVRDRIEAIHRRWPYLPNGLKLPGEWVDAGAIIQEFIRDETQARQDWGNRCVRVQIPDWPEDKSRVGSKVVAGIYHGVGRIELHTKIHGYAPGAIYNSSRGFCEFANWKPAAGGELPVLTFEHCYYHETWD